MELMKKYGLLNKENKFYYMFLGRLQMDCDYFLGNGRRRDAVLWTEDRKTHLALMREVWGYLIEKPEWLTLEQIAAYEKAMEG